MDDEEVEASRFQLGLRTRREVLGEDHVAAAHARTTPFDATFQRFITETAWGSVWARPDLDRRTRSLVTIAILAALGREELGMHLRATRNTGASPEEIAEVLLHVAVYAGVPAAHTAYERARSVLFGEGDGDGEDPPGPGDDGARR
jgi:4-carboxymuconolactone decarboxylase